MKLLHDVTIVTPTADGRGMRALKKHSAAYDGGRFVAVGPAREFEARIAAGELREVVDGRRYVMLPGLINTHHHLFQSLTRGLPAAQNVPLFQWLIAQYPLWRSLDFEAVHLAALVSLAELLLHGATTTSDHFYMFPRESDVRMEAVFEAAERLGVRLHLCRGSMTLGQSAGGLPPDDCVERDADVLADTERVLGRFHDPAAHSMRRVDLAPCSPFNVTRELIRDTVALAEQHNVLLHTHLAETRDEERYCQERYGCRPARFLDELGFLGPRTYLAHCVCLDQDEIKLLASRGASVSHCPTSNMRLASGIAPLREMLAAGVVVGLGVDGSSSNDCGNLLAEARQCMLVDRLRDGIAGAPSQGALMPPGQVLALATAGGAACLRRPELGRIEPGAAADFSLIRTDDIALAGAIEQDPVAALGLCEPPRAERVVVAGRDVVKGGRLTGIDEASLVHRFNRLVAARFSGG